MKTIPVVLSAVLFSSALFFQPTLTMAETAEETLNGFGLEKKGSYFQLKTEKEYSAMIKDLSPIKRKLSKLKKEYDKWAKQEAVKNKKIKQIIAYRIKLRAELQKASRGSVSKYNKIVGMINNCEDQITLIEKDTTIEKAIKGARANYNSAREVYTEKLIKIRKAQDKVTEKYADLKVNPEVIKALEEYNKTADRKAKLGPSSGMLANVRKVKKMEDLVLSGSIQLREENDALYVNAVFNGQYSQELLLDTGATTTALSWNTATRLGLTPKADTPKSRFELADGSLVVGYIVTAESIRVGKFTVKNVEVAVFEKKLIKASDMLGMSFLKNFNYKVDSANKKLVMSKIESSADKKRREAEEKKNDKKK